MSKEYDLITIGSGPGGYVASIRAAQLGMKVAIVEKESLGGICLNWGCIPTKSLLKSASVLNYIKNSESYGIKTKKADIDFKKVIERSRNVAIDMSKGVDYLLKKNKVDIIPGKGKILSKNIVGVKESKLKPKDLVLSKASNSLVNDQDTSTKDAKYKEFKTKNILLATGARSKQLPSLPIDNKKVINYRKAMVLDKIPKNMTIVGAGAIGCEFAYFYNSMGTNVTIIEYMDRIVPLEDREISEALKLSFEKSGIKVLTNTEVKDVEVKKNEVTVNYTSNSKQKKEKTEIVLSAVGIQPNIENLGLEELGIKVENNKILVNEICQTSIDNIYAIGDIIPGPALAHVASAEGILCVESLSGLNPEPIDYKNIPNCTYCGPEVASVGYTEEEALAVGYEIKIGKFPFSASGKANVSGHKEGFIKVIFDEKYGEWLGAHMIGYNVTDLISEAVVARKLETTAHEILKSIHPHPTLSEVIMEAVASAYNECIHY